MHKMKNQKPLSEHQKGRLLVAMEALQNPIFSTNISRSHNDVDGFFIASISTCTAQPINSLTSREVCPACYTYSCILPGSFLLCV
jgi:hypothetical protein